MLLLKLLIFLSSGIAAAFGVLMMLTGHYRDAFWEFLIAAVVMKGMWRSGWGR